MSIAGIFKEVSTISISAWVFGDQLTELNIIGVVITVCGELSIPIAGHAHDMSMSMLRCSDAPMLTGTYRFQVSPCIHGTSIRNLSTLPWSWTHTVNHYLRTIPLL